MRTIKYSLAAYSTLLLLVNFSFQAPWAFADYLDSLESHLLNEATPEQACKYRYLKSLGWKPTLTPPDRESIKKMNPCQMSSLEEAQNKGLLNLQIPENPDAIPAFFDRLDDVLEDPFTFCAYKLEVKKAASQAAKKLSANEKYGFNEGAGFCELPRQEWIQLDSDLSCYIANRLPSAAVQCFYDQQCRTECAVGRQIGEYATLLELLGKEDFDQLFTPEEIQLGEWDIVQTDESKNVFYNTFKRERKAFFPHDSIYSGYGLGAQALVGLPGYIGNVYGEEYLTAPDDRGENFVIANIEQSALRDLTLVGIDGINARAKLLWENTESNPDYSKKLASTPFFKDILVYVHPLKTLTLGDHLLRLATPEVNPLTPYEIEFLESPLNTSLYQRIRNYRLHQCLKQEDPEIDNEIYLAAIRGDKTVVETLLKRDRLKKNHWNYFGRNPLQAAIESGHEDLITTFAVQLRGSPKKKVDVLTQAAYTAASFEEYELVNKLIALGAVIEFPLLFKASLPSLKEVAQWTGHQIEIRDLAAFFDQLGMMALEFVPETKGHWITNPSGIDLSIESSKIRKDHALLLEKFLLNGDLKLRSLKINVEMKPKETEILTLIIKAIAKNPSLEELDLSRMRVNGTAAQELAKSLSLLKNLKVLSLRNIEHLNLISSRLENLKQLNISSSELVEDFIPLLNFMNTRKTVKTLGLHFDFSAPDVFKKAVQLVAVLPDQVESLHVNSENISDQLKNKFLDEANKARIQNKKQPLKLRKN